MILLKLIFLCKVNSQRNLFYLTNISFSASNDVSRKQVPKNIVTIYHFWEIKCPTYEVIHKVIGTSSIQCGALCIEKEECNGFQLLYNKTNVCVLVSAIVIDEVMSTLFMIKY